MALNFNEMLEAAFVAMKKESKLAELYQAFTGKEMKAMQVVFRGDEKYDSYICLVDNDGKTAIKGLGSPYLEDVVIHLPLKISEVEAEEALAKAGYSTDWKTLTLRSPLYSVHYPPLYIYEIENVGFIAVDSTDASNVFQM